MRFYENYGDVYGYAAGAANRTYDTLFALKFKANNKRIRLILQNARTPRPLAESDKYHFK